MRKSKQPITAQFRKPTLAERGLTIELAPDLLSPEQIAVSQLPLGSIALAVGSPASGKTTALKALFLNLARTSKTEGGAESVVAIAGNRFAANKLRDELALAFQGATLGPLARTLSSLAFSILRFEAIERGKKLPELISGSEQDAMLEKILEQATVDDLADMPKHVAKNVITLSGFRAELRDLISVAIEHSLTPQQLAELGSSKNQQQWVGASKLYEMYLQQLSETHNAHRFDPSSLLVEASKLLRAGIWPAQLLGVRQFLVDDAQELTPAAVDFIRALTENPNGQSAGLVLFGDPDAATMGFRAGDPQAMSRLVASLSESMGRKPISITLPPRSGSHAAQITAAMRRITPRINVAGAGTQRKPVVADAIETETTEEVKPPKPSLKARVFTLQQEESGWIANQLRKLHLNEGIPFESMAVVARSVEELEELEFALAAESVPVRIVGAKSALREEFGSAAFLKLLHVVLTEPQIDFALATDLLCSPIAGFDSLSLRRLRRKLRSEELHAGGERNSQDLLVDLFSARGAAATLETGDGKRAQKFLELFFELREQAAEADKTVEDLLWLAYSSSFPSRNWPLASLGSEEVALQISRNLDSVVALFAAAARYVERNPLGSAIDFVQQQLSLKLPEDALGLSANANQSVALLTPAGLISRSFRVVALAHMQEGIWPNLKPRSSLLSATTLDALQRDAGFDMNSQQRSELPSELRMLYKSVGAATELLLVSAIDTEDEQASQFVRLLADQTVEAREYTKPRYTLRGIVGRLRRDLIEAQTEPERLRLAAHLARLANAGAPGAHPESWYGLVAPSTTEPLAVLGAADSDPDQLIVHPSQLENFMKCPLHWFINAHGGGDTSFKTRVGTLMHEVLETATVNDAEHFWQIVNSKWSNIDFDSDWQEAGERRRVSKMITKLLAYLDSFDAEKGRVIGKEVSFDFNIAGAKVKGTVDRIEIYPDGTIVIADLKTSKYKVAAEKVLNNPQLGVYQLAALDKRFEGIPQLAADPNLKGARLIEVGTKERQIVAEQPSLKDDDDLRASFISTIEEITKGMSMPKNLFIAKVGEHCTDPYGFGTCSLHLIDQVTYGN